jgi:hypothetical protein
VMASTAAADCSAETLMTPVLAAIVLKASMIGAVAAAAVANLVLLGVLAGDE